jgi:hypothetical protein
MNNIDLIQEIQHLSVAQRIEIVEAILKSIKQLHEHEQLQQASAALYEDYAHDKDLTAFNGLDFEDFYEPR